MRRPRTSSMVFLMGGLMLVVHRPSIAQIAVPPAPQSSVVTSGSPGGMELTLLRSLRANPLTAPYSFSTEPRAGKVVLRGRVGTKQIHDVAIRTAIALGVPVADELLIDTGAAHQVAAIRSQAGYGPGMGSPGYAGAGTYGSLPYTYPQPLFGRYDDPFFGFEPPAIGYPPWWGALTARRLGPQAAPMIPVAMANIPPPDPGTANVPTTSGLADPTGVPPPGTIDMEIDGRGVATLRGTVPTLADRIAIGQQVARTQGVSQVLNLLNVRASAATPATNPAAISSDTPPPPPTPANVGPPARPIVPAEAAPIAPEADPASQKAMRALASRVGLANQSVRVKVRDGVAVLSGKVPTVSEAMTAYRAVQQTPGVREVDDRLEFVVPDGTAPNPLADKGRPEDVEPYLEAQIRRAVGDLAHVDRVRVRGDSLELRGTLGRGEDRERFDAIIRTMPVLRGFRITAEMPAEAP